MTRTRLAEVTERDHIPDVGEMVVRAKDINERVHGIASCAGEIHVELGD